MTGVPGVSEQDLWLAELDMISTTDSLVREAAFAIRTAVRAKSLAWMAQTDPLDELLDAREKVSDAAKPIFDRALNYLRWDREFSREFGDGGMGLLQAGSIEGNQPQP